MSKKAVTQYNGIILLTGYLQRLFVAETIYKKIGENANEDRYSQLKGLLDESYAILPEVEKHQALTTVQMDRLQKIAAQTEELLRTYFKQTPYTFKQKLAIVGSSLYAEQHVNSGIVRLGEIFQIEVNKDFHQRIKFYEQRTKMIDYLVFVLEKNEEPEEQFKKPVDPWFEDVMKNKDYILGDFKKIAVLLG